MEGFGASRQGEGAAGVVGWSGDRREGVDLEEAESRRGEKGERGMNVFSTAKGDQHFLVVSILYLKKKFFFIFLGGAVSFSRIPCCI